MKTLTLAALALTLAACAPAPLPPCPTEDSTACHWDAAKHGNGQGRSFNVSPDGVVTFTN